MFRSLRGVVKAKLGALEYILACFVPFGSIYTTLKLYNTLKETADENGVKLTGSKALFVVLGVIFPILSVNVITLSLMQHNVNKVLKVND